MYPVGMQPLRYLYAMPVTLLCWATSTSPASAGLASVLTGHLVPTGAAHRGLKGFGKVLGGVACDIDEVQLPRDCW